MEVEYLNRAERWFRTHDNAIRMLVGQLHQECIGRPVLLWIGHTPTECVIGDLLSFGDTGITIRNHYRFHSFIPVTNERGKNSDLKNWVIWVQPGEQ